jgi:hypothetical protein
MANLKYWNDRYDALKKTGQVGHMKWAHTESEEEASIRNKIKNVLSERVKNGRTVISFGCGLNNNLQMIKDITEFDCYIGYDIVPIVLEESARRYKSKNILFKLYDGTISEYDYGFVFYTLQHITDDSEAIDTMKSLYDAISENGALYVFDNISNNKDLEYLKFRSNADHEKIFEASGFTHEKLLTVTVTGQEVALYELKKKKVVKREGKRSTNSIQ